jgi:hypothetical protein
MNSGLGNYRSAVGVSQKNDLAVDVIKRVQYPNSVAVEVSEWARVASVSGKVDCNRRNTSFLQERHHSIEAPGSMPSSVDKHHRSLHETMMPYLFPNRS